MYCRSCLKDSLPFSDLSEKQFELTMQGINYPHETDLDALNLSKTQMLMVNKLNKMVNDFINDTNSDEDEYEDNISIVDCKYFSIEEFKKRKFNPCKEFSILHLNIHSVEARIILQMINYDFDFICLTESKIKESIGPKIDISIEGYQCPIGTPTKAEKGGVLIYVKKGINIEVREDLIVYKDKELESFFVEVINEKSKNEIVGVIYRHPCMDANIFTENYMQPLNEKLEQENKKVFIAGDFNFDLLNLDHEATSEFFAMMMSNQLTPSILVPTKINTKRDTVIDNIFTNQINPDLISGNLTITISDHLPSFVLVPKDNQNHLPKKQDNYVRDKKRFDKINFTLDLLNIDWKDKLDRYKEDANSAFQFFFWKINQLLDKYMPWKKVSRKEYKRKFKPWINDHILNMIKVKNNKFRKFLKCKDPIQKDHLNSEYKSLKNDVTDLARSRKKEYYAKYFVENKNNLQRIWKGIKEVINIKKNCKTSQLASRMKHHIKRSQADSQFI